MKNQEKKYWETPTIQVLDIKKDTYGGSGMNFEKNNKLKPAEGISPGASSTSTSRERDATR